MSLTFKILGNPGRDNAAFIQIDSGTKMYRLLFDCGEDIFKSLKQSEIKSIDYLFLSHLHIDHIAGFDYFFRRNFDREIKPIFIWGPQNTVEIIHHRLRGYEWNLVDNVPGSWYVTEIDEKKLSTFFFKTSEGYKNKHPVEERSFTGKILKNKNFTVEADFLNHRINSIGYRISESNTLNIDKEKLNEIGLPGGQWLEKLKDLASDPDENISFDEKIFTVSELRNILLKEKEGDKIAYLTDFVFDDKSKANAVSLMKDCDIVICESQYLPEDKQLADKNFHLVVTQTAEMAKEANAKKLILFHLSDRYKSENYKFFLDEARKIFPNTFFSEEWNWL